MTETHISDWGSSWAPARDTARGFAAELAKELGRSHPLRGAKVEVLGRCNSCDDIVAAVPGEPELAVIHLTWRGSTEKDGQWPYFERVTAEAFVARFIRGGEHL